MVLVLLTAVDQANYYVCCVTRQYLFRIHFFGSQRLLECPTYLYNYIYLLQSLFLFSNTSCSKTSVTRPSIEIIYDQVLRDKKKEPAMF